MFEFGVATSIKTSRFQAPLITSQWLEQHEGESLEKVFVDTMHEVYDMNMYERFWKEGWNTRLARETRETLIPKICIVVAYAWYLAYQEAGL